MSQNESKMASLTAVAAFGIAGVVALVVACNPNPVEYLSSTGQVIESIVEPISTQRKMDILWVIDNSGSMCQEQEVLRTNFDKFISELEQTSLDFHIGVTTTHAPDIAYSDPVAIASQLQSVPQPLPGSDETCRRGVGTYDPDLLDEIREGVDTDYLPLQQALAVARSCLKDDVDASQFVWRDEQIACALSGNQLRDGCSASNAIVDRDGGGVIDVEDLFPKTITDYKVRPKVLRSQDYVQAGGQLAMAQLRRDFACMASVGTRGYGIEKGLRAGVNAVSLEKTGGAIGSENVNEAAPNHGLIRRKAGFTMIFVTDENDCSHDGRLSESDAGANGSCTFLDGLCEFENAVELEENGTSRLTSPAALAAELRRNLSEIKGGEVEEADIVMAGIFGTWKRFEGPYPVCSALSAPEKKALVTPSCPPTEFGKADSGDRYERFIRQFENFFPNNVGGITTEDRLNFDVTITTGEICNPVGFGGALQAIGRIIVGPANNCIDKRVLPCESDAECPKFVGSAVQGTCVPLGLNQGKFCTSGVTLKLTADRADIQFDDISSTYCLPGTEGFFDNEEKANCVVDYGRYTLAGCPDGPGIRFKWVGETAEVVRALDDKFTLETIFSVDPNPVMPPPATQRASASEAKP